MSDKRSSTSNHNNKNSSKSPMDLYQDINGKKESLPYTFIPVEENEAQLVDATDLSIFDDTKYTGHLDCSMYVLNKLCVGNEHEENKTNDITTIKPLIHDGKVIINSSTLKGCISNFMSAFLKIPMTRVTDHKYSFRANVKFGNEIKHAVGIVKSIGDEGVKVIRFEGPFGYWKESSPKYSDLDNLSPQPKEIDPYDKSRKYIKKENGQSEEFYLFRYRNGLEGNGKFADLFDTPQKKHNTIAIKVTDYEEAIKKFNLNKSNQYSISTQSLKEYDTMGEELAEYHLMDHPLLHEKKKNEKEEDKQEKINRVKIATDIRKDWKLQVGDIVVFEHRYNSHEVLTFGKYFYYRWMYRNNLRDFDKDVGELKNEYLLDEKGNFKVAQNRELFGYSVQEESKQKEERQQNKNEAKAGKVHFNSAIQVSDCMRETVNLPRVGSPRASSYEFYLRQDMTNKVLNTYGDPGRKDYTEQARLSGRKFYKKSRRFIKVEPHSAKVILHDVISADLDRCSFPQFKFRITFENLTIEELNLLYFSVNLGSNEPPRAISNTLLCHQIGYGKNYGMGAVKMVIEHSEVYDKGESEKPFTRQSEYQQLLNRSSELKESLKLRDEIFAYPQENGEIFKWHSKIRQDDYKNRQDYKINRGL